MFDLFYFSAFVITGPSTTSTSIDLMLNGNWGAAGSKVAEATQCLTDTFSITNQDTVPVICGTNTGFHGMCNKEIISESIVEFIDFKKVSY